MRRQTSLINGLAGATVLLLAGAHFVPGSDRKVGDLFLHAAPVVADTGPRSASGDEEAGPESRGPKAESRITAKTRAALAAFKTAVRPLSHPRALEMAFRSYFAFESKNPGKVKKPFLYFVDYGQPSTKRRGYVFDMRTLEVVEGPFTVAHGRGSGSRFGVPTRFSNTPGSAASSLGLYLAQETYNFRGKSGGRSYTSIGLRLMGLSGDHNDNARVRGVVAHGAPYVTGGGAGRSEGCPAIEQRLAKRLLPKLARGGLVFLFAPDEKWMARDPWLMASN